MSAVTRPKVAPLPTTFEAMLAQKKSTAGPTLNDQVEAIHLDLWRDEESPYRKYIEAVWNEDAVEGRLVYDDAEAARLIRDYALTHEILAVSKKNVATLVHALGVVLRRYQMGRNQRRNAFSSDR